MCIDKVLEKIQVKRMGIYFRKVPEQNTFINIKYNPQKPQQSYIQGYDNKVYRIFSRVFMVIGLILILACLGIWIWG